MTLKAVPSPPPPDPRTRRYPMSVVLYARELREAGWTIVSIPALIEKRFGVCPHHKTVHKWVDEDVAEMQRRFKRESDARRRNAPKKGYSRKDTFSDRDLLALREDGLTHSAIVKVARRFYGEELTLNQVRYRLDALGVPKNEAKAQAARARAARRAA